MEKNYNNYAIASLVLGIIAIALWFFGFTSLISIVLGIVGLCLANKAKANGIVTGVRTGGFVCSLIGLIGGAVAFLTTVLFVGALGLIAAM